MMRSKEHLSYWQLIFSQSKANGAPYHDEELPVSNWDWPKDTYLQRRRSVHESPVACARESATTNNAYRRNDSATSACE